MKIRFLLSVGLACVAAAASAAGPADDAVKALSDGNARFIAGKPQHPHAGMDRVLDTGANGQKPVVTILGCSDSRVALERIFDMGVGDMFVVRVAGNVADGDEIGSAEYGVGHLKTPLMVVLGHTKCGAVTAVATGAQVHGSIPGLVDNIIPAIENAKKKHPGLTGNDLVPFAIDENVFQSVSDVLTRSEEIRGLVKEGKVQVVGAVYDIETGKVKWLGQHPDQSALLAAPAAPSAEHDDSTAAAVTTAPIAGASDTHAGPVASGGAPTGTVSGAAAAASKITSTGKFAAPELKVAAQSPFGPAAGKADEYEAIKEVTHDNGMLFKLFAGAASLALLLTCGMAFSLSRTTKKDGSPGRALTLGTKLAGGFGIVVTGILVLATLSSRTASSVSAAMAESKHLQEQDALVLNLNGDMWATRMFVKNFLLTNSEEDLAKYSGYAASFKHKHELAKQTIKNPERVKMTESIGSHMEEYEHKFAEVVKLIDERNGIIDGQMGPAAARATELLSEISRTAHADGDGELAFEVAESDEKLQRARLAFFKYMRTGETKSKEEAFKIADEVEKRLVELGAHVQNPTRVAWFKETEEAIRFWNSRMEHTVKLQDERNELVTNSLDKLGPGIRKECDELLASLDKTKTEVAEKAAATEASAKIQTAVVSGVISLLGAFLAFAIARGVIKGLKTLEERMKDIAQGEGDLTRRVDIDTRDEIGLVAQWFNTFVAKIERTISEVKSGTAQIDAGGSQISGASQSLAQGASEQASSLQQISASMEQMSGQTKQSAENVRQANALAEESKKSADRGQQEMVQMSKAVNEIKQSSTEISKIIKVIDEIAFQTNLLALNAAVEAARAGEAGKGFAVVAEEVRNLAQRSAEAAKNTASMIEESVKRSENGVQIAGRVGQSLEEITTATNKVNTLLAEIATAANEQATGIGQVTQGVSQLDQVTQQNAGNSEELASSAEEMSSQVASLNELVSQFKVSGQVHAAATGTSNARPDVRAAATTAKASKPATSKKVLSRAAATTAVKSQAEQLIPMEDDDSMAQF